MSIHEDASTWRLRTPNGIPYKLLEGFPKGKVGEGVSLTEEILIQASDLTQFLIESFSHVTMVVDRLVYSQGRQCPGAPGRYTTDVGFEPFEPGKPSDPFGTDSSAPDGTYAQFYKCSITFGPRNQGSSDGSSDDVKDFLEVTADAEADFLAVEQANSIARWENAKAWTDPNTGIAYAVGALLPVKSPNQSITKLVIEMGWNVNWKRVSWLALPTLVTRMRACAGKVNSSIMPLLHNADVETIVFKGWTIRKQYAWTDEDQPPVTLDMKFSEKRVVEDGEVKGHNHLYRPETGLFERYLINGEPLHALADLNYMWSF